MYCVYFFFSSTQRSLTSFSSFILHLPSWCSLSFILYRLLSFLCELVSPLSVTYSSFIFIHFFHTIFSLPPLSLPPLSPPLSPTLSPPLSPLSLPLSLSPSFLFIQFLCNACFIHMWFTVLHNNNCTVLFPPLEGNNYSHTQKLI